MDTDLLRAFVAVAECEGFSAAGKIINKTQSAVSLQIKRLEDRMGQSLFDRTSRTVTLTAAGGRLLPYARHILKLQDDARRAIGAVSGGEVIRLGISEEQATAYLPGILPQFATEHPTVRVEILCEMSADLVHRFQQGLLDVVLAVRHMPTQTGTLLGHEELVWVGANGMQPDIENGLVLALNPEGCIFRAHAFAALGRNDIDWDVQYVSPSPVGVNLPVRAGLAITVKTPRSIPEGCTAFGLETGLPPLGHVEIELHQAPGKMTQSFTRFCELLEAEVTRSDVLRAAAVAEG